MSIFFGKNLGGGVIRSIRRFGALGGRGRKRKSASSDSNGCFALIGGIVLGSIAFKVTQSFIISLVLVVVGVIFGIIIRIKVEDQQKLNIELGELSLKVKKHIDMIIDGKTLATRQNNCAKAITLLKNVQEKKLKSNQAKFTADLLETLFCMQRVLPIADLLLKAERAEFKGQKKKALDYYLDVLYEYKKGTIANRDFKVVQLTDESGEIITMDFIVLKAKALGWCRRLDT